MRLPRRIVAVAMTAALAHASCAAVFRESRPTVRVESDPPGAHASVKDVARIASPTPIDVRVPRTGISELRLKLAGFEEHHGSVRKHMNGWWLTADLATCIVPVLLCVPLLVDAISGAWTDVEARYTAHLVPLDRSLAAASYAAGAVPSAVPVPSPAGITGQAPPAAPPFASTSTMSDSERRASARAAYLEGIEMQAQGRSAEALVRFQFAQRVFDAPTHLLHIAECLASTGKLVEAQEAYETLAHRELPSGAPEPFRDAVTSGKRALEALRPRIPTLRIEVRPAPSTLRNLAVSMNQRPLPPEVLGIARPVNPGAYRVTATAWGLGPAKAVDVQLAEGDTKTVQIELDRQHR
jgi:hypothetical protein